MKNDIIEKISHAIVDDSMAWQQSVSDDYVENVGRVFREIMNRLKKLPVGSEIRVVNSGIEIAEKNNDEWIVSLIKWDDPRLNG